MGKSLILLGIFLVFVYVYNFRKIKKTKEKTKNINSVRDFHESYGHLINKQQIQTNDSGYQRYVTKYNSQEDYREKL
ncbi:MAG: hypothetical protein NC318_04625 [Blautia sp.]|nr:hypothetical protein [Lachnoclostridium sp.]MCM1210866.1 hypothetical protein [Blautia sp.]